MGRDAAPRDCSRPLQCPRVRTRDVCLCALTVVVSLAAIALREGSAFVAYVEHPESWAGPRSPTGGVEGDVALVARPYVGRRHSHCRVHELLADRMGKKIIDDAED